MHACFPSTPKPLWRNNPYGTSQDLESLRTQVAVNRLYAQLSNPGMTLAYGQTVEAVKHIINFATTIMKHSTYQSIEAEAAWLNSGDSSTGEHDDANHDILCRMLCRVLPAVPDPKTLIESAGYTITA